MDISSEFITNRGFTTMGTDIKTAQNVARDDLLPWQESEIKSATKVVKQDKRKIEEARKQFLSTATDEQMTLVALEHSNIVDLLKESKVIPADAKGFTKDDLVKYRDTVDSNFSKLKFFNADMKPVAGAIERANGYQSEYDSSHLAIAVRLMLVGHKAGNGIVGEALKDYASQMFTYRGKAQYVVPQAPNAGAELQESLQKSASEEVANARKGLLDLPLAAFAANFPSAAGEIAKANEAYKVVEKSLSETKKAREDAIEAERVGELDSFKQMLKEIKESPAYKGQGVENSEIKKKIDELSGRAENDPNFNLEDAQREFGDAFDASKKSQEIEVEKKAEDGTVTKVKEIKSGPVADFLKLVSTKNDEEIARCELLESTRANAEAKDVQAQKDAAVKILAIESNLRSGLNTVAEADAKKGDSSLKVTLASAKQVTRAVDGKEVTGTVYKLMSKERAEYEANVNVVKYRGALTKINGEVEADITKLNDPMINKLLGEAKAKEQAFQNGLSPDVFSNISNKSLDEYIKTQKEAAIKDLKGQAKKDAEAAFKLKEAQIRQAAGYISFTYARVTYVDAQGQTRNSMTGAEAMAKAHYLRSRESGDVNKEVITGASVREYEALAMGRDSYRHEMRANGTGFDRANYGAGVMEANYIARRGENRSALESFDEAVSDNAGKAMADYTHGMRRIQKNITGLIHRNANTGAVLQVGAFFAGQYVGGLIFGRAAAAAGSIGGGGTEF